VRGRVVSSDGSPIAGAHVGRWSDREIARTDAEGRYVMPLSSWYSSPSVYAHADGWAEGSVRVQAIGPGELRAADIVLAPELRVRGAVSDPEGGIRVGSVGDVEAQLSELWREASSADRAVMRACMMNLVILCEEGVEPGETSKEVARLSEQLPGRMLVVFTDEAVEGDVLEVYVGAHCHRQRDGKQVCSEQVQELIQLGGRVFRSKLAR